MIIRRLESNDTQLAAGLVKQFAAKAVSPEYLSKFLANPANYLVIAEVEGRLAGFLLAHALQRLKQESHKMFIYEIDVAEEFRRRKVGTALIGHVREIVRREKMMNAFVFTSYSNPGAVAFYQSTGGRIENGDDLMFVYDGDE